MGIPLFAARRDIMRDTAVRMGMSFLDIETPDPVGPEGISGLQQALMERVPIHIITNGPDTAIFGTACSMQSELISAVLEFGAIYPQPCCPSPHHGFPDALGIQGRAPDSNNPLNSAGRLRPLHGLIADIRTEIEFWGMSGRLSSWAVPAGMLWGSIGAEYAIMWINGEVPQTWQNIDIQTLHQLAENVTYELSGERVGATLLAYSSSGVRYPHYIMGIGHYLTY